MGNIKIPAWVDFCKVELKAKIEAERTKVNSANAPMKKFDCKPGLTILHEYIFEAEVSKHDEPPVPNFPRQIGSKTCGVPKDINVAWDKGREAMGDELCGGSTTCADFLENSVKDFDWSSAGGECADWAKAAFKKGNFELQLHAIERNDKEDGNKWPLLLTNRVVKTWPLSTIGF